MHGKISLLLVLDLNFVYVEEEFQIYAEKQERKKVKKEDLQDGIALLKQPVLPLVSMVQFMYQLSGPGTKVEEIISAMTEPVETAYTVYPEPENLLRPYLDQLQLLETLGTEQQAKELAGVAGKVVDASGQAVDEVTAATALINQRILEMELEEINSLLCAPCHCRLCCIGPDKAMQQEFFEIPLQSMETELFPLPCHDTPESRNRRALDAKADNTPLLVEGRPFYQCSSPELIHWRNGWSMILPQDSSCPALEENGRCTVYSKRPQVCRRPQIFSYILEPLEQDRKYMIRNSLLAVSDCPYVQFLQEEINAYAAACELDCILKANKG
ncbi:MAG: hypothetical protein Q3M24_09530 [Candidatus Electrothrix aestuarii]|uniref:Zinc-or iron-chelating domain-containing protein n=1 Tax=Candidatus Electrothrix aestuarii TaxID=3062594 RepID=A0AAU8M170_9BACT|nr:hypothetical protein [Candidatus Electrothrix aestuarii]